MIQRTSCKFSTAKVCHNTYFSAFGLLLLPCMLKVMYWYFGSDKALRPSPCVGLGITWIDVEWP